MESNSRLQPHGTDRGDLATNGAFATTSPPARLPRLAGPYASGAFLGGLGTQGERPGQPRSEENGSDHEQDHSDGEAEAGGADAFDPKKSRACEGCRGLKVRCEPDPANEGPCKRCKKAGRVCVVTAPTRKRQKKTDSRVTELEKKIDALTASLHARIVQPAASDGEPAPNSFLQGTARSSPTVSSGTPPLGQRASMSNEDAGGRRYGTGWGSQLPRPWNAGEPSVAPQSTYDPARDHVSQNPPPPPPPGTSGRKRKASERLGVDDDRRGSPSPGAASSFFPRTAAGDVVDRGLMTMAMAAEIFARYNEEMMPNMPAVMFPPGTTMADVRRNKPTLFLSVMAAASGEYPQLQKTLQQEMMYVFAEKVFIVGEKSLELVQALHVSVIWYWPPEHYEELKFYQLVHTAAVMAIDIGLGLTGSRRLVPPMGWREGPWRRQRPPDPTSAESRRTWLTCHFLCANTAMAMHRPNLLRWTPFMTESVEFLQSSPEAAPTDPYFCHLIWTHRHAEEIAVQFSVDDSSTSVNLSELRTQHALRALQRDLNKYRASIPTELRQPTLEIGFHVVSLFMNELAVHADPSADHWRPPFTTDNIEDGLVQPETALSSTHIGALSACLAASTGIIDVFLAVPIARLRCLPVYNFVRVAFALVILLKMHFSVSSPARDLAGVFERDSMRAEHYIEALLAKFRAAAADDKCRPATKFSVVLTMLKAWFLKHGKDEAAPAVKAAPGAGPGQSASATNLSPQRSASSSGEGPAYTQQRQQHHPQQLHQRKASTPLQLLSEVATVGDPMAARSSVYSKSPGNPRSHHSSLSGTPTEPSPAQQRRPLHQSLPGPSLPPLAPRADDRQRSMDSQDPNPPLGAPASGFAAPSWINPPAAELDQGMDLSGMADFESAGLGGDLGDVDPNSAPMFFMNEAWLDVGSMMPILQDPNLFFF
ncbi:Transcription factor himD [Paramyrothecium foliicola]|nr:Transcription factor himD [Paramyrothecium foliicola]